MPVAHHTRAMSTPRLRKRGRKVSLSPCFLFAPSPRKSARGSPGLQSSASRLRSEQEEVASAIASACDESLDDPDSAPAVVSLPRLVHARVRRVPGFAVIGAAAAPTAHPAVPAEMTGGVDDARVLAPDDGGEAGHPCVQVPSADGDSSRASFDSIEEVGHMSGLTLEGRAAWDHYFITSRWSNGLPPYFPQK